MAGSERDDWLKERIVAYTWHCGDYVCDCTQPVVERITPNTRVGYPWIHRERLWSGDFHSSRTAEEADKDDLDLAEAAERFGAQECERKAPPNG